MFILGGRCKVVCLLISVVLNSYQKTGEKKEEKKEASHLKHGPLTVLFDVERPV